MRDQQAFVFSALIFASSLVHAQDSTSPKLEQPSVCMTLLNDVWSTHQPTRSLEDLCAGAIDNLSSDGACSYPQHHPQDGDQCSSVVVSLNGMILASSYRLSSREDPPVDPWHQMLEKKGVIFGTKSSVYMENLRLPAGIYRLFASSADGKWTLSIFPITQSSSKEMSGAKLGSVRMTSDVSLTHPELLPGINFARNSTEAQLQFAWHDTQLSVSLTSTAPEHAVPSSQ